MSFPKRILFVDDDARALKGLDALLDPLRRQWEVAFADSGVKALEQFAQAPFDVVVADLRMPGMSGSEMLQEIMARYPSTTRLLLAGAADRTLAAESLGVAHQFLIKPLDFAFFQSLLEFTTTLGGRVGNTHVRELVARIGQLPAVPEIYREIIRLMDSETASNERLGAVIGKDMAMTAMTLKLANSAMFSHREPVSSPAEAVSYLGIDLLKALVLAHGLFGQVGAFRIPTFSIQHLWAHSLAVASGAQRIAETEGCGADRSAAFFTAGLLHDVGILILASRFPDDYVKVLDTTRRGGGDLESAEHHVFGATHGEVGAYLLGLWGLPAETIFAAAHHHQPRRQAETRFSPTLAVHVADAVHGTQTEHPIFATAHIDESYLAALDLASHLEAWKLAAQAQD